MLTTPFLTDLDSRAAVRGSRDPLGIQTIWTRFGRHVVGNLTTVTTSVRDFTILLLGYYFAERLAEAGSDETTLHAFLKWEQLASYARAEINKDTSFRGTERVEKRLSEGKKVTLSADPAWTTLGDQKNYGLWGLYTVPARASGHLDGDPPRLLPAARDFVEAFYVPMLTDSGFRRGDKIVALLGEKAAAIDPAGRDRSLLQAVARLIKPRLRAEERAFYRAHLLLGGPHDETGGLQRQLVSLLGRCAEEGTGLARARTTARADPRMRVGRGTGGGPLRLRPGLRRKNAGGHREPGRESMEGGCPDRRRRDPRSAGRDGRCARRIFGPVARARHRACLR
jgi:hypothetical protein